MILGLLAGTTFISPQWMISVVACLIKNTSVFLQHILSIFGGNENVVIEIAILLSLVWLHLSGICVSKTLLSSVPLTTFWPQTPFWPWWLLHNPTSVIDICQILYAYHAIKGNLSDDCSPASQCSNLPVVQQLSASFAPVTHLCWFTALPQIHQRSTVYLQKPSKTGPVFAHTGQGKESYVTG